MKSEIVMKEEDQKERTYPWLGHDCAGDKLWEKVVLFTGPNTGVVSALGDYTTFGKYGNIWLEERFTEFKGKVILSND